MHLALGVPAVWVLGDDVGRINFFIH
jgi:hypothetical protein